VGRRKVLGFGGGDLERFFPPNFYLYGQGEIFLQIGELGDFSGRARGILQERGSSQQGGFFS